MSPNPIRVSLRECWYDAADLRSSTTHPEKWAGKPIIHAITVETILVEPEHRRQGHARRFLEELCRDERFEMVVVEGVGNPILAAALMRWGWNHDPKIMDFFKHVEPG